jgi:hypothetical protein
MRHNLIEFHYNFTNNDIIYERACYFDISNCISTTK